ncbi:Phosphoribosyl 1,2-cyclic phosphodiesterase [Sesbania bispinosa]|nr:Phosphoribosyl 1,2-cyclic phosphodiesterase [Sesbania bispinosa]
MRVKPSQARNPRLSEQNNAPQKWDSRLSEIAQETRSNLSNLVSLKREQAREQPLILDGIALERT